jgi:hypothetical protein
VADRTDSSRERPAGHAARLAIAIVLAMGIGLGVPLLWVWIGSKLQGGGADTVESTTAALIFAGIVVTYVATSVYRRAGVRGHRDLRRGHGRG